jgi:hypothetical protein
MFLFLIKHAHFFLQFLTLQYHFNFCKGSHPHGQGTFEVLFSCLCSFIRTSVSPFRFLSCHLVSFHSILTFIFFSFAFNSFPLHFSILISYLNFPLHLILFSFFLSTFLSSFLPITVWNLFRILRFSLQ